MIPRLTEGGSSFKGAALYYLHDKREEGERTRDTAARVAWTFTLNLPTQDPDRAWRMMAHTAMTQAALKSAAGVKASGRKLTKPVMAFSLSWAVGEAVTPHDMLEAAKDTLARLGLEQHQALIICHNDTPHPHIHLLINRVNPDIGVAHTGSLSKEKLSDWAYDYRAARAELHFCPARIKAHAQREARRQGQGRPVSDPQPRQRPRSRPQWEAARSDRDYADAIAAAHADLFAEQAGEERAGQARRQHEAAAFWTGRRAARTAIRDRYQAALDAERDPAVAARHVRLAELLINAKPELSLEAITRDRSTFTRQELARHVGRHTANVEEFRAVLDRLETSAELVALARDERGHQRLTTRAQQTIERDMEHHARALHQARHVAVPAVWPKGVTLSRDQDAALKHVTGKEGIAAVTGFAGTGKSTMLAGARRSWEGAGLRVQGMALSGVAADGLKNGSGIDSRTIMSRVGQWEKGINRPTAKDVIVVDEAGMIGSRQMEQILRHASQGGAKVVLVGDPEQLQAIEAGGAYRAIVDRIGSAELNTVRRQIPDWQKQATCELATRQTEAALSRYEAAGTVHRHEAGHDARAALIDGWRQARADNPSDSQIMLAFTRADVRGLNDRARAVMREEGKLGPDVPLKTESGRRSFATGDRIYFLKNDAGLGVRNGTPATIERIKGNTIAVRLDGQEGRRFMFGTRQYGHIDHGYAATIHKSQGVTVDRVHMLATPNFNRHLAYVGMTRHRERLDVHWSEEEFGNRARLVRVLGRQAVKDTSLDYETDASPDLDRPGPVRETGIGTKRTGSRTGGYAPAFRTAANANTLDPVPRNARGKLAAERRATKVRQQRETADRRHDGADQRAHADAANPPREARPTILHTAEITAFDDETAQLAAAMAQRHADDKAAERGERFALMMESAGNWQEAMLAPVERERRQWAEQDGQKEQEKTRDRSSRRLEP